MCSPDHLTYFGFLVDVLKVTLAVQSRSVYFMAKIELTQSLKKSSNASFAF